MSDKKPVECCQLYTFIMDNLLGEDMKLVLHKHKNIDDLTPLDLSAELCLPEMLKVMIRTDGVYRFLQRNCGVYDYVWYDVTTYEQWNKNTPHILHRITNVSEAELGRFAESKIMIEEPFNTWANSFQWRNIFFYFLFSLCQIAFFIANLQSFLRFGACITPVSIILCIQCLIFLTSECANIFWLKHVFKLHWKRFKLNNRSLIIVSFQKISYIIFSIALLILAVLDFTGQMCHLQESCFNLFIVASVSAISSCVFYFQVHATLSHYVVIMQEMIIDCFSILSLASLPYFVVVVIFYLITLPPPCDIQILSTNYLRNSAVLA